MRSEFLFQLLDGVGPLDWLRGLIVAGDEIRNCLFQGRDADEMVRLKELTLHNTKPDLNLIQPRRAKLKLLLIIGKRVIMDSFACRRSYNFMSMDCFGRSSTLPFCLFSSPLLTKRVPGIVA